ncbi:response regulator [Litoribrevibacter albus]|uniref:histidine kinase n=1 Tax=Litoribrevibacter albus TaxID=1473156 RepID=A0AA37W865_9GAMM|nr:response regulator [Litoribrevibacter albus]GLQ33430.1 hybrid sensor histidine kinase/response regulator [Litoribrevibacter albus]
MKYYISLTLLLFISIFAKADNKIDITNTTSGSDLTAKVSIIFDPKNELTYEHFSQSNVLNRFTPNHTPFINISKKGGTYWLQLALVNPSRKEQVSYIKIRDLQLAETNIYQAIESSVTHNGPFFYSTTGNVFVGHDATYIRIKIPEETSTLNLIRIHPISDQRIELLFLDKEHYQEDILENNWMQGIFAGILITLVTTLLYLYRTSRNTSSLAGAAVITLIGFFYITYTGQTKAIFDLNQLQSLTMYYLTFGLAFLSYLSLTLYLCGLKSQIKKILIFAGTLGVILMVTSHHLYANHLTTIIIPSLVACLAMTGLGFQQLTRKNHIASNLVFSSIIASVLLTANIIHALGITPDMLTLGFEDSLTLIVLSMFITTAIGKLLFIHTQSSNRQYRENKVRRELITAKNSFLAQFSHEMRTPLNGVVGMTELLFDTPLSNNQREYISTIQESGERLMTMINDVIDYTRIESRELSLNERTFDLQSVVVQCLTDFSREAEQKQIELITDIANDIPQMVRGDNERLRQILHGLISHLFNLIEHGEIIVSVESNSTPNQLRFQIRDTGIGFKKNQNSSLFDAYQQSKANLKTSDLSLNLSMIQELIHLMGGELHMASEFGKGNVIWFTANMPASEVEKEDVFDDSVLEGLHLLAVDDNVSITKVIAHHAHSWGMETSIAHGGPEALAILRNKASLEEKIDVVILDYKMPIMNGIELAAKIKEDNLITNDVLVIMLTGLNFTPNNTTVKNAGIRHILTKPVSGSALKQVILKGLGHITHSNAPAELHQIEDPNRHKTLNVLIAEDNQVSTKVICGMLRKIGVSYEVTSNGEQAYDAFRNGDFNIVLMDCEMPIMDGFEATQAIRDWEKRNKKTEVPIIALSAHVMPQQKAMCMDCGMNDYIEKPIELSTLRSKLRDWAPVVTVVEETTE